jgi:hypothetical protein
MSIRVLLHGDISSNVKTYKLKTAHNYDFSRYFRQTRILIAHSETEDWTKMCLYGTPRKTGLKCNNGAR